MQNGQELAGASDETVVVATVVPSGWVMVVVVVAILRAA
jgi:hypothetical protein